MESIEESMTQGSKHDQIESCLSMLSSRSSDESKFVALLLLPRLLDNDDPESLRQVFAGMNFKFLERLLKTQSSPDNEASDSTMKEIALHIISSFCSLNDLVESDKMTERIPTLSKLLVPNDQTEVTQETLNIFLRLSMTQKGVLKILQNEILSKIISLLSTSVKVEDHTLVLQIIRIAYLNAVFPSDTFMSISALPPSIPESLILSSLRNPTLPALTILFRTNQEQLKFDLMEVFTEIIDIIPVEIWQTLYENDADRLNIWLSNLRIGLRQILTSRLTQVYRNKALLFTSTLLRQLGPSWLFSPYPFQTKAAYQSASKDLQEDAKFPALAVRLACIEIKLLMDTWGARRSKELQKALELAVADDGDEIPFQEEEKDPEYVERVRREEEMIPACYIIMEMTIQVLMREEDIGKVFDPFMLFDVREAMIDCLKGVMEVLADLKDSVADFKDLKGDMIMLASVRIVAAWISEDDLLMRETADLMPLFIAVCRETIPALNPSAPMDFTQILIPAFLHTTTDQAVREIFMLEEGHELIIDYLSSSWDFERDEQRLVGPVQLLVNLVVSGEAIKVHELWDSIYRIGKDICSIPVPQAPKQMDLLFTTNYLLLLLLLSRVQKPKEYATIVNSAERWFGWFDKAKGGLEDIAAVTEVVEVGKAVLEENL